MSESLDKNCVTQEDGSCIGKDCMHDQKPVIEGVSSEDSCMKPVEVKAEEAAKPGHHERPWGMPMPQFIQYMTLLAMGMERLDKRQRYVLLKQVKQIRRELDVRWPFGRPIEDIQREIAEQQAKAKIIIPQGVNADALKEPPRA